MIDGKNIRFKTNGAIPLRYKAQFGRDYFKDILKMMPAGELMKKKNAVEYDAESLEALDFEVFSILHGLLLKTAES